MYKPTLCAWHIHRLTRTEHPLDLTFVTDRPDMYRRGDLERMFAPWQAWARLAAYIVIVTPKAAIETVGSSPGAQVLVNLIEDADMSVAVKALAEQRKIRIVEATYPPAGLDNDLVREVAHHDFELGGRNEWDGSAMKYSDTILRRISSAHCHDEFPHWAFPRKDDTTVLTVLDIGCGPISVLRWGAMNGFLRITGVDPLLDMYRVVLARHGLDRLESVRLDTSYNATAECLSDLVPPASFDVVFTNNALDHTQRPDLVMRGVQHALRSGGLAIIQVATREGTRQNWDQLHKTDIFMRDSAVMYQNEGGLTRPLLAEVPGLKLTEVHEYTQEWLSISLARA